MRAKVSAFRVSLLALCWFLLLIEAYSKGEETAQDGRASSNAIASGYRIARRPNASTQDTKEKQNEVVVVLGSSVPRETSQYLALISGTTRIHIAEEHESLASIAKAELGRINRFLKLLFRLNSDKIQDPGGPIKNVWSEIPSGTEVRVPDLVPLSRTISVTTRPGLSFAELASPFYENVGPKTRAKILRANPKLSSLDSIPAGTSVTLPDVNSIQLVRLNSDVSPPEVLMKLQGMSGVKLVSPNVVSRLEEPVAVNHNILTSMGSSYDTDQLHEKWFASLIGADKVTDEDLKLTDHVIVAVLDSGLDFSQPAFAKNLWENSPQDDSPDDLHRGLHGYDFANRLESPDDTLPKSHGTHVAGIASGRSLGKWFQPFKWDKLDSHIKLMPLKVSDDNQNVNLEAIMSAMEYTQTNGARVASASWSTANSDPLRDYLSRCKGLLLIVAAGNGQQEKRGDDVVNVGQDIDKAPAFPASFKLPNMIVVGAFDPARKRAFFSNYGNGTVNLLAPGVAIMSTIRLSMTVNAEPYGFLSGTSQATPFVTFAAALLFAKNNGFLTAQAVKNRILDTVEVDSEQLNVSGGRLNLLKAISIDHDLMELKDGTILRGQITTRPIRFVEGSSDCKRARPLSMKNDGLSRVLVDYDGSGSLFFINNRRVTGTLCDATIDFQTENGPVTKRVSEIRDLVWRGVRGNPLGY